MKKILTILLVSVICVCSLISVSAYTDQYIFDFSESLSYSEIEELENTAQQIENNYGYCVMFCITDEDTYEGYEQNIYDTYTDNEDGIIFVHDLKNEMYYYYVTESAKSQFTATKISKMQNAYDSNSSYFGGIEDFYIVTEDLLGQGGIVIQNTEENYTTGIETTTHTNNPVLTICICILVGMAIGFVIILSIASKNKSVRMQKNATEYTRPGSFVLTGNYDNFLYKNIDKKPKPKQENKG